MKAYVLNSDVVKYLVDQSERNTSLDAVLDRYIKHHAEPSLLWDSTRGIIKKNHKWPTATVDGKERPVVFVETRDRRQGEISGTPPITINANGHFYIRIYGPLELQRSRKENDNSNRRVYDDNGRSCMRLSPVQATSLHGVINSYIAIPCSYQLPTLGQRIADGTGGRTTVIPKANKQNSIVSSVMFQGGCKCPCSDPATCEVCSNIQFLSPQPEDSSPLHQEYLTIAKNLHIDPATLIPKNYIEYKCEGGGWSGSRRQGTTLRDINNLMAKGAAIQSMIKSHGEEAIKAHPTLSLILEEVRQTFYTTDVILEVTHIYSVKGGHYQFYGRPVFSMEYSPKPIRVQAQIVGRANINLRLNDDDDEPSGMVTNEEVEEQVETVDASEELPTYESDDDGAVMPDIVDASSIADASSPPASPVPSDSTDKTQLEEAPAFTPALAPPSSVGKKRPPPPKKVEPPPKKAPVPSFGHAAKAKPTNTIFSKAY